MKIGIANDHAGVNFKSAIQSMLEAEGYEVKNFGTDLNDSVDYPDFAHPVANGIQEKTIDKGILICGTGNGVAMTANKYKSVRAGLAWNRSVVELLRQHNDANVLCIPARFINIQDALDFVKLFLNTNFEGGRHSRRVEKICS